MHLKARRCGNEEVVALACKFRPSKVVYPEASIRVESPRVICLLMFVAVVHFYSWHCCRSHANSAAWQAQAHRWIPTFDKMLQNVVVFVPALKALNRLRQKGGVAWYSKEHFGWSVVIFLGMAYLGHAIGREVVVADDRRARATCPAFWSVWHQDHLAIPMCNWSLRRMLLRICKRTCSVYSPIVKGSGSLKLPSLGKPYR